MGVLVSFPDGTEYGFSWDEANQMQSVTIPGEGVIAYSEYDWQQPATIEFPGGTTRKNTYDGLQRHKSIQVTDETDQVLMDYQYTWDGTGNITERATEHGVYSYGYDDIDRLTEAEYPTFSAEEWTYDPLGNRMTDTGTGETEWQYNANNELLSSVEHTHEFDDNGSLIAEYNPDGTLYRTFEYNAENRMSTVRDENGELIAEYLYDPFGRRVNKTVYDPPSGNPEITWYVYNDQGLMAELDQVGNATDFYLFPPDGLWSTDPILRKSGSSYYYYQTGHLGTPQQLVDGAGAVVHSREMRAFGETQQTGIEDRWRFPGQFNSDEVQGFQNFHRKYFSGVARYTTRDPLGLQSGLNSYEYVGNNPVRFIDPQGLVKWEGTGVSYSLMLGYGGGTYDIYNLVSECVLGVRYRVTVHAKGASLGVGAKIHPNQLPLGTAAGRKFTFRDDRAIPDPDALSGAFRKASYGAALGVGFGGHSIRLGEALSNSAISLNFGLDASVGVTMGKSQVLSRQRLSCPCN